MVLKILLMCAILTIACADNHMMTPTTTQTTTVGILQGVVTIGPMCPVETQDHPCLPPPSLFISHKLVILDENGASVEQVDISGTGEYKTELKAGIYKVDFTPHDIGIPGSYQPPSTEVRQGQTTTLDVHIDTGIR